VKFISRGCVLKKQQNLEKIQLKLPPINKNKKQEKNVIEYFCIMKPPPVSLKKNNNFMISFSSKTVGNYIVILGFGLHRVC